MQPIALKFEEYKTVEKNLLELKKLKELVENNEKNECEKEISFEQQKLLKFTNELEKMLISFNASKQSVIIEIVSMQEPALMRSLLYNTHFHNVRTYPFFVV